MSEMATIMILPALATTAPHCGMSGAAGIGADQTTVPLNIPDAPQPANEVTEPLTVSQPVVSQPAKCDCTDSKR